MPSDMPMVRYRASSDEAGEMTDAGQPASSDVAADATLWLLAVRRADQSGSPLGKSELSATAETPPSAMAARTPPNARCCRKQFIMSLSVRPLFQGMGTNAP